MVEEIVNRIVECIRSGNKVLVFGVGGNSTTAMHFAAELAGKFEQYESPYACVCICENMASVSAIATDFGWNEVFKRQIKGLAKPGDLVLAFSISTGGDYLHEAFLNCGKDGWEGLLICGKVTKHFFQEDSMVILELGSLDTPWVQEEQLRLTHKICGEAKRILSEEE